MTTSGTCVWTDIYGYAFPCDQVPDDPCVDDGNGHATLWRAQPCDGDGMSAFCTTYADHPVCANHTTTVAVGEPPVPVAPLLPATGTGIAIALLLALTVAGIGAVVALGTRWTR